MVCISEFPTLNNVYTFNTQPVTGDTFVITGWPKMTRDERVTPLHAVIAMTHSLL